MENNEKIVLEKLANMGFVMKLHDDFCDIPSAIKETDYPLNIYICINNKPIFIILRAENPDALASGMNAASSV